MLEPTSAGSGKMPSLSSGMKGKCTAKCIRQGADVALCRETAGVGDDGDAEKAGHP